MKRILALIVGGMVLLAAAPADAQQWNVVSPDKQTATTVTLSPDGRLSWHAREGAWPSWTSRRPASGAPIRRS